MITKDGVATGCRPAAGSIEAGWLQGMEVVRGGGRRRQRHGDHRRALAG